MSSSSGASSSDNRATVSIEQFKLEFQELEEAKPVLEKWRGNAAPVGTLVERWVIQYTPLAGVPFQLTATGLSRPQMARYNPQSLYKRLTLLVRSLFTYVRVLPAYRLHKVACQQGGNAPFWLEYKIHSTLPPAGDQASAKFIRYEFSPVETADGQFRVAVQHAPASAVRVLGQAAARLPRPASVMEDYVGTNRNGSARPSPSQLETAPSAPAALGMTPRRRSWSSSFRLSPARVYEGLSPPPSPNFPASYSPASSPACGTAAAYSTSLPSGARPPRPRSTSGAVQRGSRLDYQFFSSVLSHELDAEDGTSQHPISSSTEVETAVPGPPRRTSAPVTIPGSSRDSPHCHGDYGRHRTAALRPRGLKSSGDLGSLVVDVPGGKPLSAPPVSHMRPSDETEAKVFGIPEVTAAERISPQSEKFNTAISRDHLDPQSSIDATVEGTELARASTGLVMPRALPPSFSEAESIASSSAFPTSCSPEFPLAFSLSTPSSPMPSQSPPTLRGAMDTSSLPNSSADNALLCSTGSSPRLAAREVPSGTVLMRRASWTSRSVMRLLSGDQGSSPTKVTMGYSVSPLRDVSGSGSMMSSTPRQLLRQAGSYRSGSLSGPLGSANEDSYSRGTSGEPQLLLTFPTRDSIQGASPTLLALPFDFSAGSPAGYDDDDDDDDDVGLAGIIPGDSNASPGDGAQKTDVGALGEISSVGAFVRLVQEAQPLVGAGHVELAVGIAHLESLRCKIQGLVSSDNAS